MILSHSLLCSPLCKCYINEDIKKKMELNYFTQETFSHISDISNIDIGINKISFNIENCSSDSLETIQEIYKSNPNNTKFKIEDFHKFHEYWKGIEKRFKCTGWCTTKYTNPFSLQNDTMVKYVFSDVNRGVVDYPGCLNRLVNWIPSLVAVVGALLITCGFVQIINLIFTLLLLKSG